MKKGLKRVIVAGVAIAILVGAGAFAYFNFGQAEEEVEKANPKEAQAAYKDMQEVAMKDSDDPMNAVIDFTELQKSNADVCAWIRVPGTNVDYPVLRSETLTDDYYLNTTLDGKVGLPGSIYMEKYNAADFSSNVTLLYGHTFEEDTMFTQLHKYSDRAFFDANQYVYIYLPDKTFKYQIFAAVAFDDRYILGSYSFDMQEDFMNYVEEVKATKDLTYACNVNETLSPQFGDKVLSMSTCITEAPEKRWIVNAVLVESTK